MSVRHNVYTRLKFLKAVSHSMGVHRCDPYTEATDSDSDSPDDDQASADAGAATVNATDANDTDNCEVCLVAQREPRLALVPCGHQRFCEACIRHRNVLEVVVLSAVRTSTWFYVCFDI